MMMIDLYIWEIHLCSKPTIVGIELVQLRIIIWVQSICPCAVPAPALPPLDFMQYKNVLLWGQNEKVVFIGVRVYGVVREVAHAAATIQYSQIIVVIKKTG